MSRPAPVAAPATGPVGHRSLAGTAADWLTVLGIFLAPVYGLGFGGRQGLAYADVVLGFAAIARGFHLLIEGIPILAFRRQSFLFALITAFLGFGLISGFVNGNPMPAGFIFIIVSLFGTFVLVITYARADRASYRQLLMAFTLGCAVLGLSSFTGPKIGTRAFGWAVHPNALGHSCVMGVAAAIWLWDNTTSFRLRVLWLGAAGCALWGIVNSGSRGGILGVGIAGLLYLILRGSFRVVLAALAGAWLLVVVLSTGAVKLGEGNPLERLFSGNETTTAANAQRRDLLANNFEVLGNHPIFGEGFDSRIDLVHVVYFQGWIGGGFVDGLLIMGLGATMVLMPFWQRRRDLALACGAAGIAVAWGFTNILTARDQWAYISLTFALSRGFVVGRPRAGARVGTPVEPA